MAQTIVSSPFTDNRMTLTVSHSSHGFDSNDIGKAVMSSGTDGRFQVARANTAANAEVVGVITSIDTANQYTITTSGFVDVVAAVPTATAGTVFFLAEAADSQLTSTEPTTAGAVSKPIAVITESNAKMLLIHYRGEVITSAVIANAPNDATYVTLTTNSSLSAERTLAGGTDITLVDAGVNGAATLNHDDNFSGSAAQYTAATVTVNATGHITAIAAGSAGPSQANATETGNESDVDKYVPPDLLGKMPGAVKAYGQATSAGVVAPNSFNITGVGKDATGDYTWTWATNFSNDDYAIMPVVLSGVGNQITVTDYQGGETTSGAVGVETFNTSHSNSDLNHGVAAVGDQ